VDSKYYDTVTKLEKDGINREYIMGWMSGYLHNPELEEQRVTDAYTAGYENGRDGNTEGAAEHKA